jgi:hypothetical protein
MKRLKVISITMNRRIEAQDGMFHHDIVLL